MYRFQKPNKPIRAGINFLDTVDDRSTCDIKFDGFRTEVGKFDKLHFFSREDGKQKVTNEWPDIFNNLIPEGCELDVEWLNPTRIKAINTHYNLNLPLLNIMVVFDVRWYDGKYLLKKSLKDRRAIPVYANLPEISIENILETDLKVVKVPSVPGNKAKQFYDLQTTHWISEGLVIKRLLGDLKSTWFKIKYRD